MINRLQLIFFFFTQLSSFASNHYFFQDKIVVSDTLSNNKDSIYMDEIVIHKQDIKVDRGDIIYDVWSSKFKDGFQSIDILKRMPFVFITDQDISIKSKNNVIVYVNNVKINLIGKDLIEYLEAIPSDKIKKITISGNNSSKFESNTGGVIHILLKNPKNELGISLNTAITQRKHTNFTNSFLVNYNKQKFSTRYGMIYLNNSNIEETESKFIGKNINKTLNTFSKIKKTKITPYLDIDYQFNKKLNIGLNYNLVLSKLSNITNNNIINNDLYHQENYSKKGNIENQVLQLYTTLKLDSLGSKLNINTTYFNQFLKDKNMFSNIENQNYRTHTNLENLDLKIDVLLKKEQILYEFGTKLNYTKNTYEIENLFNYHEKLYNFYFNTSFKIIDPIDIQIGVRYENYSYKIEENYNNRYFLLPNLQVSYTNNQNVLSFTYNKRVIPPYFIYLNPYKLYTSSESYIQGNPNLIPSTYQDLNLSYSINNRFFFSLYHSNMKEIITYSNKLVNGIMERKYINDSDLKMIGTTINLFLSPFPWLNSQILLDALYSRSNLYDKDAINKDGFSYNLYLNTDININSKTLISSSFSYIPEGTSLNFKSKSRSSLSFALKGTLIKDKLTYRIFANDIFRQERKDQKVYYKDYKNITHNYSDTRSVGFSFNYKLGGKIKNKQSSIAVERVEM